MAGYNAVFRVDQVRAGGTSLGTPGVSRRDLWVGCPVVLTPVAAPEASGTTFKWEFLDLPAGSSSVFLDAVTGQPSSTARSVMFTPDAVGRTYRIQLTINKGQFSERRLAAACYSSTGVLAHRGWRFPAYKETGEEANFPGQTRGYAEDMDAILTDMCSNGFAYKYTYPIISSLVTSQSTTPRVAGSFYYDPVADLALPAGVSRSVKFQAVLETSDAEYAAYVQLYDKSGCTGSVGLLASSLLGPCVSTTGSMLEVDVSTDLGGVTTPGILECWVWMGTKGDAHVTCSSARLLLTGK